MTQDEIIRMAVECQLLTTSNREGIYAQALVSFAKLVAEAEKEQIAKKIEQLPFGDTAQSFAIWVRNDT